MFARQNTSSLLGLWVVGFYFGWFGFFLQLSQLSDTAKMYIVYCCFNENEL